MNNEKNIICTVTLFSVAIGYLKNSAKQEPNAILLADVEALSAGDASSSGSFNPVCINGGVGSTQCSIDGGISVAGYGVSSACSVSCGAGYYSCCGLRCTCKKI